MAKIIKSIEKEKENKKFPMFFIAVVDILENFSSFKITKHRFLSVHIN